MLRQIPLEKSWSLLLEDFFNSEEGEILDKNIETAYNDNVCYPPMDKIFAAFNNCKFEDVKVVIIGQDPYHGAGEANGMAFSSDKDTPPPTLVNIFKAIKSDYPTAKFETGNLTCLAKQGVLFLNSCLTVSAGKAMSHKKLGWQNLVAYVIDKLVARGNIVFLLWGQHAQKFLTNYDRHDKIKLLKSVHPSPLSAYQGFFACHHFKACNDYLAEIGKSPIDWSIQSDK